MFTAAKTWKQPKWPSADEWMKKTWSAYTVEHHLATEKDEIISAAVRWT